VDRHERTFDKELGELKRMLLKMAGIAETMIDQAIRELVEFGATKSIFTTPQDKRTEEYVTGRYG
jgi:ABC-type phosphate transport system ATPase subunit